MTDTELIRFTVRETIDAVLKEKGIRVKNLKNKVSINWAVKHYGITAYSIRNAIEKGFISGEFDGSTWNIRRDEIERHFDLK